MTYAGVPWRTDLQQRMLTDLLGPRPPMGVRPQGLEALAVEVRRLLNAPGLNPDSNHEVLAALRRAELEVPDTRASTLRQPDHPVVAQLPRLQQPAHLFQTKGRAWDRTGV